MIELQDISALKLIKEKISLFYLFAGTNECGYCTQLKQDMLAHQEFDDTNVIFVDVDKHTEFSDEMNIEYIPTLFVYQGGKIVDSFNNVNDINLQTLKNTYG